MVVKSENLKDYFSKRADVAFAFLYGSYANGTATKLSDVDVAIYFYPHDKRHIEFEDETYHKNEDAIWADLEHIAKKEVELLVLNRAPATVAASAIRGVPLAINDWRLYLRFMEIITAVAEDFSEFLVNDYMEKHGLKKRD
ncbi:MAG TPA: nucleotidyltransferase domain-containing protein [bacterium]